MQKNKAVAFRWFTEGWMGNLALAYTIFRADFSNNGIKVGPFGPQANVTNRLNGFPDLRISIEDQFIAEEKVVTRLVWRGTHRGSYSGVEATGKPVEVLLLSIWRFEADWVVENWSLTDQFGLLEQVGVLPLNVQGAQVKLPEAKDN